MGGLVRGGLAAKELQYGLTRNTVAAILTSCIANFHTIVHLGPLLFAGFAEAHARLVSNHSTKGRIRGTFVRGHLVAGVEQERGLGALFHKFPILSVHVPHQQTKVVG